MERRWTVWVIVSIVLVLVAYDVFIYLQAGGDATISDVTLGWAKRWTVVPFAVGVLCGHLFWPQYLKGE